VEKTTGPKPPDKNCFNCRFKGEMSGGNICRFRPPTPVIMMGQGLDGRPAQMTGSLWAPITNFDWCGEHRPQLQ